MTIERAAASPGNVIPVLQEPPFFIVGSGRSGTTLMRTLLSAHSRLTVTPETHFLKSCTRLGDAPLDGQPADFWAFWRAYCETPRFALLGVLPEDCSAYFPTGRELGYADAFTGLLRAYLDKMGKARVGEKTPRHLYHTAWLFEHFPEARIIVMRRDPRAMLASQINTPWRQKSPDLAQAALVRHTRLHAIAHDARNWARVNGELVPQLERDPRIITIRYEDLVADPQAALKTVTAHLGEAFEPAMLERREDENVDPSTTSMNQEWVSWMRKHEATAHAEVTSSSLEKWRRMLLPSEVAIIEAVTGEVMQRVGYAPLASTAVERRKSSAKAAVAQRICDAELSLRRALRRVIG